MAKINGVNHTLERATPNLNTSVFDRKYPLNYVFDNFCDIHAHICWPMVDTVEEVLADFDRIITKRKLKIVEPNKTTFKKWERK